MFIYKMVENCLVQFYKFYSHTNVGIRHFVYIFVYNVNEKQIYTEREIFENLFAEYIKFIL